MQRLYLLDVREQSMTIPISTAISATVLIFLAVAVIAREREQKVAKVQADHHEGAGVELDNFAAAT